MNKHAPTPWTLHSEREYERMVEVIRDAEGNIVHEDRDYYPSGLESEDARFIVASANVAHAFRKADKMDWEHLLKMLPDSGHGKSWKAVLAEARQALGKA